MFEKRSVGFVSILAVLLGACAAPTARAQVIVVPNALATTDGNSFRDTPAGAVGPFREMRIYDASQFAALSGPVFITQFALRPDATPGPSGPRALTLQIFASTTSRSVAGLSRTFAENIGPDNTRVFNGTLTWRTDNLPEPGNTRQFDIVHPLTTPFRYDPRAGNLVLDFQIAGITGSAIRVDVEGGDPTIGQLVGFGSATATTGDVLDSALVAQFTVQPVPEPSTFVLVSLGALGLLGSAWRRRRHRHLA
jgi:hypothetical protein